MVLVLIPTMLLLLLDWAGWDSHPLQQECKEEELTIFRNEDDSKSHQVSACEQTTWLWPVNKVQEPLSALLPAQHIPWVLGLWVLSSRHNPHHQHLEASWDVVLSVSALLSSLMDMEPSAGAKTSPSTGQPLCKQQLSVGLDKWDNAFVGEIQLPSAAQGSTATCHQHGHLSETS